MPEPSAVEVFIDNPDYNGGIWTMIDVALSKLSGKSKRVNITLPERMLVLIDEAIRRSGRSLSEGSHRRRTGG